MRKPVEKTISATEFKAKCLALLDQLAARELHRVNVTKRGRVVGVLTLPDATFDVAKLHGFLRGSVRIPDGVDLTAPVIEC